MVLLLCLERLLIIRIVAIAEIAKAAAIALARIPPIAALLKPGESSFGYSAKFNCAQQTNRKATEEN